MNWRFWRKAPPPEPAPPIDDWQPTSDTRWVKIGEFCEAGQDNPRFVLEELERRHVSFPTNATMWRPEWVSVGGGYRRRVRDIDGDAYEVFGN